MWGRNKYQPAQLKGGEIRWVRAGHDHYVYLGRHEIARIEFAKWEAKRFVKKAREVI